MDNSLEETLTRGNTPGCTHQDKYAFYTLFKIYSGNVMTIMAKNFLSESDLVF